MLSLRMIASIIFVCIIVWTLFVMDFVVWALIAILVLIGGVLNLIVVIGNKGRMPVIHPEIIVDSKKRFSTNARSCRFSILADRFLIKIPVLNKGEIRCLFSVGDIHITFGIFIFFVITLIYTVEKYLIL